MLNHSYIILPLQNYSVLQIHLDIFLICLLQYLREVL